MKPAPEEVKRNVRAALREDVGSGDINAALIPAGTRARASVITRQPGCFLRPAGGSRSLPASGPGDRSRLAGGRWRKRGGWRSAAAARRPGARSPHRGTHGAQFSAGSFRHGHPRPAPSSPHRGAAVRAGHAQDPAGLRAAQKYAGRVGGARNHRSGLYDGYLLKENHIAAAGGIAAAVREAQRQHPEKEVHVEVETNAQLEEAIVAGAQRVLLDNHSLPALRDAVKRTAGRVALEVPVASRWRRPPPWPAPACAICPWGRSPRASRRWTSPCALRWPSDLPTRSWCRNADSNRGPTDYESVALPN